MNFFASQDDARKNTKLLIVLFIAAVLILITLTNAFVIGFTMSLLGEEITMAEIQKHFDIEQIALISIGIIALIAGASLYKMRQLSGGGAAIAMLLDGELLVDHDGDPYKRRVLNVVEEMAIASGNPVPTIYIFPDQAINAFAAGTTAGNASIGITTGTMTKLTRDQLQGVIAHEFSHIHNGDMRLNIRLIGILYGILFIGLIGRFILRSSFYRSKHRSNTGRKEGGAIPTLLLGLGLMIIGYAGTFFGNIIKAAVSRQREFLADASAVQFTRNPDGIAGALKRIGGNAYGSKLRSSEAEEISHALFSDGVDSISMFDFLATHPPLEKRIRAVEPYWDGEFEIPPDGDPAIEQERQLWEQQQESDRAATERERMKQAIITGATVLATSAALEDAIGSIGNPGPEQIDSARRLLEALPPRLKSAAESPYSARAVIYTMLLDEDGSVRERQLSWLEQNADTGIHAETLRLYESGETIDDLFRLPLIELCMPALRQLSLRQFDLFRSNMAELIKMDRKVTLKEWVLQKLVLHHLEPLFGGKDRGAGNSPLSKHTTDCQQLLSFLIHAGRQKDVDTSEVFAQARDALGMDDIELLERKAISLKELDDALDALNGVKPLQKPALLHACATCITADGGINITEIELYRTIAALLDCPMPPLKLD